MIMKFSSKWGNSWDFLFPNVWRERDPRDCLVSSDSNVAFAYSGSVGASGGILTLWDTNTFSLESEIVGRNFVVVVGTWVEMQGKVGIMNVYAPQDRHLKEALWSSIESILGSVNITWIVFGDFNVVRSQEERSGCRFNPGEANIFNDFIYRCRLFDFLLGGRKFTRCLCFCSSENYLGSLPDPLKDLISSSWAATTAPLPPDVHLKNKLKALRLEIKKWSADRVASDNRRREEISKNLVEWDEKAEEGGINQYDISKREEWILDMLQLDRLRNEDMKQKCRLRWAVEGDENSRFFHSILKNRYAKFSIKGIHVNKSWVESSGEIKQAALDYYAARFKESNTQRPLLDSPRFKNLSEPDADFLESDFTIEEVRGAVWDCAGSKAPRLNFNFIKTFWDVVKTDF
ncbi:RNA-directed DNA polymerase, eukaryota [Tanacetum coccineum]